MTIKTECVRKLLEDKKCDLAKRKAACGKELNKLDGAIEELNAQLEALKAEYKEILDEYLGYSDAIHEIDDILNEEKA